MTEMAKSDLVKAPIWCSANESNSEVLVPVGQWKSLTMVSNMIIHGRGAWSVSGVGGTLSYDGTESGPYYCLPKEKMQMVGQGEGWGSPDVNIRAVRGAVQAIQRALNRRLHLEDHLTINGIFDSATAHHVELFQRRKMEGQTPWGGIGPDTARALFLPDIKRACSDAEFKHPSIVCGLIKNESAFDPGAVGYVDPSDMGLAQINGGAHPEYDERERLYPQTAITFVMGYLKNSLGVFGEIRDSIASYNLGQGGTRSWISDGRPDIWTPRGSSTPRDVKGYIDRIEAGCTEFA